MDFTIAPDHGFLFYAPLGMALLPLCYGCGGVARTMRRQGTFQAVVWIAVSIQLLLRLLDASVQEQGWPWAFAAVHFCFACYLVPVVAVMGIYAKAFAEMFE